MSDYLSLEGISVTYGAYQALQPTSLNIRAGEFFSLLGPSGCGKSTTLNVVAGFLRLTAGRVVLDGRDITDLPPQRRQIGVVFQNYALFPHMTAAENIAYGLRIRKLPRDEIQRRVAEALSLVQLDGKGDRYPKMLSGGEQQRVAIARALAIQPELLLLDEPLSNLDARLREEMRHELKRIQRSTGVTTIFVTHDQEEAFGAADRIAVMSRGRVEQVGDPVSIYRRPETAFVAGFIGRSNRLRGRYDHAAQTLSVAGVPLRVHGDRPDLDGKEAILFLRPEDMRLAPDVAGQSLAGQITSVSFGGATMDLQVQTPAGLVLLKQIAGEAIPAPGETVAVSWDPARSLIIDPAEA